jgi:hypothetical protein
MTDERAPSGQNERAERPERERPPEQPNTTAGPGPGGNAPKDPPRRPAGMVVVHSEQVDQIATALAAAQGEMSLAVPNAQNTHFGKNYADLGAIREAARPALAKHKIAFSQIPTTTADGTKMVLTTMLIHGPSGQWLRGDIAFVANMNDPQKLGSLLTYLKRYAAAGMTGVAAGEEDDDGEAAQGRGAPPPARGRDDRGDRGDDRRGPPPQRGEGRGERGGEPRRERDAQPPAEKRPSPAQGQSPANAGQASQGATKPAEPAWVHPYPADPAELPADKRVEYDKIRTAILASKTVKECGGHVVAATGLALADGSPAHAHLREVFDTMMKKLKAEADKAEKKGGAA